MNEFFSMGGYAGYVWPSYLISAAVMVGLLIASLRGQKAAIAELKSLDAGNEDGAGETQT
ncbi:MAG: heme exporter protein CcmD [Rhodospirillaceae bacterium]|nr:heme exporter protein CcmD [Rhodospirillaceae bacterium]